MDDGFCVCVCARRAGLKQKRAKLTDGAEHATQPPRTETSRRASKHVVFVCSRRRQSLACTQGLCGAALRVCVDCAPERTARVDLLKDLARKYWQNMAGWLLFAMGYGALFLSFFMGGLFFFSHPLIFFFVHLYRKIQETFFRQPPLPSSPPVSRRSTKESAEQHAVDTR